MRIEDYTFALLYVRLNACCNCRYTSLCDCEDTVLTQVTDLPFAFESLVLRSCHLVAALVVCDCCKRLCESRVYHLSHSEETLFARHKQRLVEIYFDCLLFHFQASIC